MKDSDPATAPVVASTGALYVDASDEKKDSEAVEVRAVETSDAVEFAGENVEEVAEAEAEPVAQTFADKIKNLIASLQKPKEETESMEEAKPEQKAEPETVELVHAVDEKTGEDVMVVKAEEEVEQKSVKEQLADVIDTAVVALSKAPDFRLIFVGELLLVFLCIAIWPPLVQNIGVAILFPPVLLATAAASIMWQRTPDSLPDLVSLRVPPEMSEELTLRVRQIKQKGSELDKLSQAILDVQKDVEKLIPHTDAIDVKMNTICSILDQSDNVLHEELLVVPEDVDVFEVDEEEEVVVVKPKTPKIAPRRSAPPPSDMTQFLNAMFFPSSNSADGKGVNPKNVRKKKKAAKAKAEIEKQASEAAEEATNPVLGTRRSDMSSRRGSDKKSN
uniref:Uncharacterized protein n=1 Tax=Erythrolobus madagascarensis TaxID=708628 RepID=A0A7S0T5N0_9RHOD|mmetsp:Transcript_1292/g.2648  ORF Transcript_1292/g.2648 Transcript_1292/m.2648 type:complete len:390 (+) Transcript_1292:1-1170(+)